MNNVAAPLVTDGKAGRRGNHTLKVKWESAELKGRTMQTGHNVTTPQESAVDRVVDGRSANAKGSSTTDGSGSTNRHMFKKWAKN